MAAPPRRSKCTLSNICGAQIRTDLRTAIEDPVLAPFAQVTILDSKGAQVIQLYTPELLALLGVQRTFGVGNNSFPAVIKSVQVGGSNGFGVDIEIVDQEGGDFKNIYQKISRGGTSSDFLVELRYGWISTNCGEAGMPKFCEEGSGEVNQDPKPGTCSPTIKLIMLTMSVNYSQGTIRYTLNCRDMISDLAVTHSSAIIGGGQG
jgi:hypothetical protein